MKNFYSLFLALFISVSVFAAGHVVSITTNSNVTCFGTCNGSVTASVSGGVGPFTYSWSSGGTSATETGLCAGNDTVYCTDNSDMSMAIAIVTITQPTLLTVGAGGSSVCSGGCTILSAGATGGTLPYNFIWSGGLFGATPTACPVSTTTYTVTVTDQNGCVANGARMVTVMPLPIVTVNSPTICLGGTATLTGGGASFYVWSTGATTTTINVSPATTTSYTVTGTSPSGCTATALSTVTVMPLPVVTVNSPTICSGDAAILTCGGATTYIWSAGATSTGVGTATASTVTTTTYTVTGSTGGCTNSAVSTVTVNPLPTITVPTYTTCYGSCVTITATSTVGATFLWWGAVSSLSSTIIANPVACPLVSTSYTVTATSFGCSATTVGTVNVDPLPSFTLPPSYNICSGMTVPIGISPTAGYTYSWIPGSFLTSPTISDPVCWPPTSQTYTLTVTDITSGCTTTASTTVYLAGAITSGITSTNTTGCGVCDGTATLSPSGGTPPYVPSWGTTTITGICPGTYAGTITDANGCSVTDSTTVFSNNDVTANFTMVPDSTNAYNFFAFNSSSGTGNSYDWSWGDGSPNSTIANPSHTWGSIGVMTVCLTVSNFLCGADTLCQTVNVTGVPTSCLALFNIADDTLNSDPNAHYVYNLSYGSSLTYLWDFGDGTNSTSMTPSHVYSGTGPYLICLSVDNGAGCTNMYCDSLISADSINRSSGTMQFVVYDVPHFQGLTTGIPEQKVSSISVYPNPFNDNTTFVIDSKRNELYSFELTDVIGKKIRSVNGISEKEFQLSRNGIQNGIYFYKIYNAESVIGIGKLIIK